MNNNAHRRTMILVTSSLFLALSVAAQEDSSATGKLIQEATALGPLVTSSVATTFLKAVPELPSISPRVIYMKKEPREYISEADFASRTDSSRAGFEKRELNENFYYYTRYGTPLAFVRPLDLVAQAGLTTLDGAKVVDFGFGSIGQLRLMAGLGASVTGIEVDPVLQLLYSVSNDTGVIPRSSTAAAGPNGNVTLLFGSFPTDTSISQRVPNNLDLFISKNTLKRGYIHPEREADPRMLVHLGVDDSTFVRTVYNFLKPGGYFMIYNLHPAQASADKPYIPWADGRSPFDRALFERVGFTVVAFDVDDTPFAHTMAKALGWDVNMKLDTDLFGTYTLLRK